MARLATRVPFDRDANFVIIRPFTLSGVQMKVGAAFDKTLVTVRRHRQLYERRLVDHDTRPVIVSETRIEPSHVILNTGDRLLDVAMKTAEQDQVARRQKKRRRR